MTEYEYRKAKQILAKIDAIDENIRKNEEFVNRLCDRNVETVYLKSTNDAWAHTPIAAVAHGHLKQFITTEIHSLKSQRESLEEAFEEI